MVACRVHLPYEFPLRKYPGVSVLRLHALHEHEQVILSEVRYMVSGSGTPIAESARLVV